MNDVLISIRYKGISMRTEKNGLFLIMDEHNSPNGITDRFKAIVGSYYIAKCNGIGFHLIHRAGFDMRDYLRPNQVSWSAELSDISILPWQTENISYLPPYSAVPKLNKEKQYICRKYIGKNNMEIMGVEDWQNKWRELFLELFTPAQKVVNALADADIQEHYTAVNVRFINSLGTFEKTPYNAPLPKEDQEKLIAAVLNKISECQETAESPIIVSSDNIRFLDIAAEKGFRTIDPTGTGHIMNPGVDELVYLKTFVNLFLLTRADKIISVLNAEGVPKRSLYKTQYPRYAAIVGNKPFIRV